MNATGKDDPALRETSWPMPATETASNEDRLEWRLRYGSPSRSDILAAVEILAAYRVLIVDSSTEQQQHRLAALRRVYRQRSKR